MRTRPIDAPSASVGDWMHGLVTRYSDFSPLMSARELFSAAERPVPTSPESVTRVVGSGRYMRFSVSSASPRVRRFQPSQLVVSRAGSSWTQKSVIVTEPHSGPDLPLACASATTFVATMTRTAPSTRRAAFVLVCQPK